MLNKKERYKLNLEGIQYDIIDTSWCDTVDIMYALNLFMEHSGELWWEQNIFLFVHHKHFG